MNIRSGLLGATLEAAYHNFQLSSSGHGLSHQNKENGGHVWETFLFEHFSFANELKCSERVEKEKKRSDHCNIFFYIDKIFLYFFLSNLSTQHGAQTFNPKIKS